MSLDSVTIGRGFSLGRNVFLLALAMCLPNALFAVTFVDLLTPVTVTIPTKNLNDAWILCDVPIGSCNANSPFPLINVVTQSSMYPAFSDVDRINNLNADALVSGYITFIGLDASALDHVVIGLRNGFVNVGGPWPFLTPEIHIAAAVLAGGANATADLRGFFLSNLTAFPQVFETGGTL